MGLPEKLLGTDEHVVLHLRTHGKALVLPALILVLGAVVVGVALAVAPSSWQPWAGGVIGVLAALVFVSWVLLPFLRWLTTTYTFTDRRVITRQGIINKSGHDLPLTRINNVAYERSLLDRILGCGTLVLTTAAEKPVTLHDIPDVERVHVAMTELLFSSEAPDAPEHNE
ncbi:MAG: PH domain-containing protein [Propionicimonas sp.]|uniref:PH domain-containing protein n=1 Tax=Propionicimonas sp. TaxID=1955623 RepID=UPI002B20439B|nr:PH domain-containing protein [Propionicimonas sp.]MEA4943492.1 PH domain-containing protein [Propionicimonas sp.]MEA5055709.1 PH domain-containing protein [Propionicimonas sp.]